ncbi:hypothetical protein [Roseivirga seohaensis]|uniref:hypothetical protein n=1 Tax=Roseivirga seohaensis TaxID=1914963 RepID=UPI003BAA7D6B
MNQTTKINKLKHMRSACLKLQMQHGELCVFRVEDAEPPAEASKDQIILFIKEQRSKRAEEAKALEVRIIALKASMQAFVKRHGLDPAITSICFSAEEKARKATKKSITQTTLFATV